MERAGAFDSKYADAGDADPRASAGRDLFVRAMNATAGAEHEEAFDSKYEDPSPPKPAAGGVAAPVPAAAARPVAVLAPPVRASMLPAGGGGGGASGAPAAGTPAASAAGGGGPSPLALKAAARLRAAFASKGITTFRLCRVKFKAMAYSHKNRLDQRELSDGLKETVGLALSAAELAAIFEYLDADGDGFVQLNELWAGICGEVSPRRMRFVNKAFDLMDRDGDGYITIADVRLSYNAKKHPKVISGERTAESVLQEFLENFESVGRNKRDGRIDRNEWAHYYQQVVSPTIDDDDYFELMMRNAWHISGGEGWCANTTNRRVLVTASDGSQSVQEVQNDLRIRASDEAAIRANLAAQGVTDVASMAHGYYARK